MFETDNEEEDRDTVAETGLPKEVSSEMVVIRNNWKKKTIATRHQPGIIFRQPIKNVDRSW